MLQTNALEICGEAWFFDRLLLLLPAFQIGCMSVLSPVLSVVRILTGNSLTALESSLLFALFVCSIVRSFGFLYANLRYSLQFVLFLFFFCSIFELSVRRCWESRVCILIIYFRGGMVWSRFQLRMKKRIYALTCTDLAYTMQWI